MTSAVFMRLEKLMSFSLLRNIFGLPSSMKVKSERYTPGISHAGRGIVTEEG